MAEAVEDHRGSLEYEPRSIYGRIVSSADRSTSVREALQKTHKYGIKHYPEMNVDELSERARKELDKRFGENGASVNKMYFDDEDYKNYLKELRIILNDKEAFKKRYILENDLDE